MYRPCGDRKRGEGLRELKNKDVGEAVIRSVTYPNKGHFYISETKQKGIVKNVIPGQKVRFRVYKNKNHVLSAHLLDVLEKSLIETRTPVCENFGRCGGCIYQTVPYQTQLGLKAVQISGLIKPVITAETIYDGIKASPHELEYRNKLDLSFGNEVIDGPLTLGMHKTRTRYTVLNSDTCRLAHRDLLKIGAAVRDWCAEKELPFYNKVQHTGFLRYLMLRRSETTGEILICLAASTQMTCDFSPLVDKLLGLPLEGTIVGFYHADDDRYGDALIPDELHCVYGRDFFYESLLGLRFRISLFSFFQTNTKGAEILYDTVRQYVRESFGHAGKPVLYDLYCGTGTIAQLLAKECSRVYGIEVVPEAVEAAKANAEENGIDNCVFVEGDVPEKLEELPEKPDYVILDPPREGVHEKALKKIHSYGISNMVYVSCNAVSFVRDMHYLKDYGWRVVRYSLVDMFPETQHIETVVLMRRA